MINIRMNKVINPVFSAPVADWDIDKKRTIDENELSITIEFVHIEWDSFTKTCLNCYRNNKNIEQQIYDLINTKDKFHSSYVNKNGLLVGTVEKIGGNSQILHGGKIKVGDKVLFASSSSIPVHIDEISKIDYDFGNIYCKGYTITTNDSILLKIKPTLDTKTITLIFDKYYKAKNANEMTIDKKSETICIITKDPINAYVYLEAIKFNNIYAKNFYIIIDISLKNKFEGIEEAGIFSKTKEIIYLDIANPLESYKKLIKKNEIKHVDYVLLSKDINGAELLALLISKTNENVFFSNIKNKKIDTKISDNNITKTVKPFSFNSYEPQFCEFALKLTEQTQEGIKKYYKFLRNKYNTNKNCSESKYIDGVSNLDGFVFKSKIMSKKVKQLINIAKYDCNVIIEGDTGTGKEMAMKIIHSNSSRAKKPCVKINCATIQESLAESEFFGYEKGSFTGALSNGKDGYFYMANNGILFLDEIEELSMNMQSKLLRVIQENSFYKVGGTEQINVDVRIICASNKCLKQLVEEGEFREDLFYRLNIATVYIPSLKERIDDIECLSNFFLKKYNDKYKTNKFFAEDFWDILKRHDWPGNVRELENTVHRLVIASEDEIINGGILATTMEDYRFTDTLYNFNCKFKEEKLDFADLVKELEKEIIEFALNKCGTTRKAAQYLNMSHTTFIRKKNKITLFEKSNKNQ